MSTHRPHLVMGLAVPLSELEAGEGRADLPVFRTVPQERWRTGERRFRAGVGAGGPVPLVLRGQMCFQQSVQR